MIKIFIQSLILPLKIIFDHSLEKGKFPEIWKKANVVPVHKKEDKMLVKSYRPISLLPIFGKMFERVFYSSLFNYFQSNKLFTPSQSGFLPGDSCIAQLLSRIHEIQSAFDENVRGVFLDISKAFDKVWHDGIIFKLKAFGVEGELLSLLRNYLENRQQKVVLNGQTSEWKKIMPGVLQGSALGPLLFVIYINDLPDEINSLYKIFADDTSLFSKVYKVYNLSHPPIKFNKIGMSKCPHQNDLRIVLDSKLNFCAHVDQKIKKCNRIIGLIRRLSITLPRNALLTIYKSFVRSHLDYSDILYDKPNNENFQSKFEKDQYSACLAITGAIQGTSRTKLYDELGLHSLIKRCWCNKVN